MLDGTNEGGQRSITAFFPGERYQEHQLDPGVLLPRGLVAPPVAFNPEALQMSGGLRHA